MSVQFGNLNAVKICLENGATIDEIIETDSNRNGTAVHVAASQGSLEILKLMAEKQPDLFSMVIHTQDSLGMTPLHRAAMFDHVDVCEFLISQGADIDALDKEKRTPLLMSASRNCVKMICYLLINDANIKLRDSNLCNFVHLIIKEDPENQNSNNEVLGKFNQNSISSFLEIIEELIKVKVRLKKKLEEFLIEFM